MASLFSTIAHSFINTLIYLWSLLKAFATFRAPPSPPASSRSSFLVARERDLEWGGSWVLKDKAGWHYDQPSSQVMTEARLQHLRLKAVNTVMTEDAQQMDRLRQSPPFASKPEHQFAEEPGSPNRRIFYDIALGENSFPPQSLLSGSISDPFSISIYSGDTHGHNAESAPVATSTPGAKRGHRRGHKRSLFDTITSMQQVTGSCGLSILSPVLIPPPVHAKPVKAAPPPLPLPLTPISLRRRPESNKVAEPPFPPVIPAFNYSVSVPGRARRHSLRRVPAYVDLHTQKKQSISSPNTATGPLQVAKCRNMLSSPRPPFRAQVPSTKSVFGPPRTLDPAEAREVVGEVKAVFDGLRARDESVDAREVMNRESYWTNATHGTSACGNADSSSDSDSNSSSSSGSRLALDSDPSSHENSVKDSESSELDSSCSSDSGKGGATAGKENDSDEEEYGDELPRRRDSPPMPYPTFSIPPLTPTMAPAARLGELKNLMLDSPLSALTFNSSTSTDEANKSAEHSPASTLSPSFPLTPLPSTDIAYLQKDQKDLAPAPPPYGSLDGSIQDILSSFEDLVSTMGPKYQVSLGEGSSTEAAASAAANLSQIERSSLIYGYHAYDGVSEECVAEWYDVLQLDYYS